jgi:hypothetical protein
MASDKTGEIYVLGRTDGGSVDSVTLETPKTRMAVGAVSEVPILRARQTRWGALWRMFGANTNEIL